MQYRKRKTLLLFAVYILLCIENPSEFKDKQKYYEIYKVVGSKINIQKKQRHFYVPATKIYKMKFKKTTRFK